MYDAETLVHAFISYLYSYHPDFSGLQFVLTTAVRILTKIMTFQYTTPIQASLCQLAVQGRADIKVHLLSYKALHSLPPHYLSEPIKYYTPACGSRLIPGSFPTLTKNSAGFRAFAHRALHLHPNFKKHVQ